MSLRWKILLVITLTGLMIIGAVYAVSEMTFMKSYQEVENQNAQQMVERADKALNDDIQSINTLNHDWAAWDDTYNFVQNPGEFQSYINDNPTDVTFASAKLNFICIINNSDQLVFGKGFDLDTDSDVPIPENLDQQILGNKLSHHDNVTDSVSGIILLPDGPLLISSEPILTSQGKGPIEGTIIMARYLNTSEINALSTTVQLPLSFVVVNSTNIPTDFQGALSFLSIQTPTFARPFNSKAIAGYKLVPDIYGQPALMLKITMPRTIYVQSMATMRYFLLSVLGLAILFGALVIFLLNKLVLARLSSISIYTRNLRKSGDLSQRLSAAGNDELSQLTRNLNSMVDTLQQTQEGLLVKQQEEERLRLTIESVAEGITSTDLDGKITDVNDSKVRLHGYSAKEELIGKNVLDLVTHEDFSKVMENMRIALETGYSGGGEYVMLKKDGSTFISERSTALLRNARGEPTGFVISTRDVTARKRAEEQYSTIVEKSNDAIITIQDNMIKYVNSKMAELTGMSLNEVLGKPMTEFISPKYRLVIADRYRRRTIGELVADKYDAEIVAKNGEIIPVEISVSVIQFDDKPATVSIIRDIRERKLAQEKLLKSEEKYSTIVEKGNDGVVILQNGVIRFANTRMHILTGFSDEETIGKTFIDFVSEQFRPIVIEIYKKRTAGEKVPTRYEIAISNKDGQEIPVEVNANQIDFEGKPADMAIIRDITERKKAEEAQKLLENNFRNSLNDSPMGVTIADLEFNSVYANQTFMDIFGYENFDQVKASPPQEHYTPQAYADYILRKEQRARGEPIPDNIEIEIARKDGTIRHLQVFLKNVLWDGKQQYQTLYADITERKEATDQLAKLNEELKSFNSQLETKVEERTKQLEEAVSVAEGSNRAKSDFLASMSHELRTPLNAIIGFSQVLNEKYFGDLNDKQSEYVVDIVDSGKHLLSLINDILDLSKIEAGKMELDVSEVKISELLQNSLVMIKEKALAHSISLDLQIAENINGTKIKGDERRLKQVMFNLLSNSAKFTPDGGAITIAARKEEKELEISVSDTGIGMTPQEQKKLFEAFYQASGGIKGKTPGTGLGLAITKSIVEKHGGKIWMESEGTNKGSKFTFTLPL
jgi:PAS domain S-box-containing protein